MNTNCFTVKLQEVVNNDNLDSLTSFDIKITPAGNQTLASHALLIGCTSPVTLKIKDNNLEFMNANFSGGSYTNDTLNSLVPIGNEVTIDPENSTQGYWESSTVGETNYHRIIFPEGDYTITVSNKQALSYFSSSSLSHVKLNLDDLKGINFKYFSLGSNANITGSVGNIINDDLRFINICYNDNVTGNVSGLQDCINLKNVRLQHLKNVRGTIMNLSCGSNLTEFDINYSNIGVNLEAFENCTNLEYFNLNTDYKSNSDYSNRAFGNLEGFCDNKRKLRQFNVLNSNVEGELSLLFDQEVCPPNFGNINVQNCGNFGIEGGVDFDALLAKIPNDSSKTFMFTIPNITCKWNNPNDQFDLSSNYLITQILASGLNTVIYVKWNSSTKRTSGQKKMYLSGVSMTLESFENYIRAIEDLSRAVDDSIYIRIVDNNGNKTNATSQISQTVKDIATAWANGTAGGGKVVVYVNTTSDDSNSWAKVSTL